MSAQTPQTEYEISPTVELMIEFHSARYFHPDATVCSAKEAERIAADLTYYKALCEELREALKYARRFMKADSDIAYVDIAVMKADHALKKAEKDI